MRILSDNPGVSFSQNLDIKFAGSVNDLLKEGADLDVQHALREMLDSFQIEKSQEETLKPLISMWQNEKAKYAKKGYGPGGVKIIAPLDAWNFH